MAVIQFYEKPGCIGNARQKQLLRKSGHHLVVHDLLTEAWSAGRLRRFFGTLPVAEWFNRSAPAVKEGELIPEQLDADTALPLMIENPLLIRRPLMEANGRTWVGFEPHRLDGLLSLNPEGDLETCPNPDAPCSPD